MADKTINFEKECKEIWQRSLSKCYGNRNAHFTEPTRREYFYFLFIAGLYGCYVCHIVCRYAQENLPIIVVKMHRPLTLTFMFLILRLLCSCWLRLCTVPQGDWTRACKERCRWCVFRWIEIYTARYETWKGLERSLCSLLWDIESRGKNELSGKFHKSLGNVSSSCGFMPDQCQMRICEY